MPELTLKLAEQLIQTLTTDQEEIKIGRARDNDIVIENLNISRYHAAIRQKNGLYYLQDNGSSNGTTVNGIKISKTEIIDGDVIGLGKYKIHFKNLNSLETKLKSSFNEVENTIMVEAPASAQLRVIAGKLEGRTFPLVKFETTIGKATSNDIVFLDDWLLSKQQATIIKRGNNEFQIIDLGGLRKVKINGTAAQKNQILKHDDVIEFGSIRVLFESSINQNVATGRIPEEILNQSLILPVSAAAGSLRPQEPQAFSQEGKFDTGRESDNLNNLILESLNISDMSLDDIPAVQTPPDEDSYESEPELESVKDADVYTDHSGQAAVPSMAETIEKNTPHEEKSSSRIRRRNRRERERLKKREKPSSPNVIVGNGIVSSYNSTKPADNGAASSGNSDKEILIWEAALNNPSAVIRKQAARMLKSLTGKDYDVE